LVRAEINGVRRIRRSRTARSRHGVVSVEIGAIGRVPAWTGAAPFVEGISIGQVGYVL